MGFRGKCSELGLWLPIHSQSPIASEVADSQMFAFGTKALEQFVNRLMEWPQYCNHILQISHLRVAHAEPFASFERAYARISSG
ncbi:hypothetical protein AAC387_Pa04g2569 [Persea americana]